VRGDVPPRRRATQFGISLVETLVALALGLAMVSVAFNLYVSNRSVFRQIEGMVRLQESASIATALLETEIRHAAGTLCRNNPPTTTLLNTPSPTSWDEYKQHMPPMPYAFWQRQDGSGLLGLHGYESINTDPIVGDRRLAGDSISIMSDNMGKVARVTAPATHTSASGTGGLTGSYTFPVDNGLNFPVGTVAMACDYTRAVLFQVTESTASTIKLQANEGQSLSPGNCAVTMKRGKGTGPIAAMDGDFSCYGGQGMNPQFGEMYTFGPGSMVAEHTFHHWYIGRKTNTTDGLSLYSVSMRYGDGEVKLDAAEEMVQDVTDMQIEYLPGLLYTGFPAESFYKVADSVDGTPAIAGSLNYTYRSVTAVRIVLTLTSPDKVGLGANNAASAATYTVPINAAIRARMPGVVRR